MSESVEPVRTYQALERGLTWRQVNVQPVFKRAGNMEIATFIASVPGGVLVLTTTETSLFMNQMTGNANFAGNFSLPTVQFVPEQNTDDFVARTVADGACVAVGLMRGAWQSSSGFDAMLLRLSTLVQIEGWKKEHAPAFFTLVLKFMSAYSHDGAMVDATVKDLLADKPNGKEDALKIVQAYQDASATRHGYWGSATSNSRYLADKTKKFINSTDYSTLPYDIIKYLTTEITDIVFDQSYKIKNLTEQVAEFEPKAKQTTTILTEVRHAKKQIDEIREQAVSDPVGATQALWTLMSRLAERLNVQD